MLTNIAHLNAKTTHTHIFAPKIYKNIGVWNAILILYSCDVWNVILKWNKERKKNLPNFLQFHGFRKHLVPHKLIMLCERWLSNCEVYMPYGLISNIAPFLPPFSIIGFICRRVIHSTLIFKLVWATLRNITLYYWSFGSPRDEPIHWLQWCS